MNNTNTVAAYRPDRSSHVKVKDRENEWHDVEWPQGQSLMEALRDHGLPVLASCGGVAACATCHVHLEAEIVAKLGERSGDELDLLEGTQSFDPERSRLACQVFEVFPLSGIAVELAPEDTY